MNSDRLIALVLGLAAASVLVMFEKEHELQNLSKRDAE